AADGVVDKIMTAADKTRLAGYEAARAKAVAEAKGGGAAQDVAVLDELLAKPTIPFSDFDMTGNWQCRTIKAGGLGALVIYGWFKCKVTDDGSGWMLEKLTGSQRTKGRFYTESDMRQIYLGSFYVAGDPAKSYGNGRETDQVGYAMRTGPAEWRIELPLPEYESTLDVLEFRR
ncbi:DUF4893 domain-containing protein, partial [Rhizobiaceae sp. 2RAB30]